MSIVQDGDKSLCVRTEIDREVVESEVLAASCGVTKQPGSKFDHNKSFSESSLSSTVDLIPRLVVKTDVKCSRTQDPEDQSVIPPKNEVPVLRLKSASSNNVSTPNSNIPESIRPGGSLAGQLQLKQFGVRGRPGEDSAIITKEKKPVPDVEKCTGEEKSSDVRKPSNNISNSKRNSLPSSLLERPDPHSESASDIKSLIADLAGKPPVQNFVEHAKSPRDLRAVGLGAVQSPKSPAICDSTCMTIKHLLDIGYEHDPFSPTIVLSAVNCIHQLVKCSLAIVVCETNGKVLAIQSAGWQLSSIQRHKDCIESIGRRIAKQNDVLISIGSIDERGEDAKIDSKEAFFRAQDPLQSPATPVLANKSFCVNLNEISEYLRTPLMAWKWHLENSGGFLLLIMDASEDRASRELALVPTASQPLNEACKQICRDLDTWVVLGRSKAYLQMVKKLQWALKNGTTIAIGTLIFIALMATPVPYRPNRECVIEPEKRQYVSSTFAGRIAECLVRPGDQVTSGQLLAKLDGEEVLRELATAEADLDRAGRKFNSALAQKLSGEIGLAKVEILKAETLIASLRDKLDRLEVRANNDGIVVMGDWHKSIGAPVEVGQHLFEIASLESMVAEVHLDAQDLGHISIGDSVTIRSEASNHAFRGTIHRIEPRAKVEGSSAYFVADVVIEDPKRQLRPGMLADAKISAGWKMIGWLLFARPVRWISSQWIW